MTNNSTIRCLTISAKREIIKRRRSKEKVLEMSIEELDLSVRSYNCLKREGSICSSNEVTNLKS